MTWKELKEKIEGFTEAQQNEQVCTWGTVSPFSDEVKLRIAKQNYYYNSAPDDLTAESDLSEYNKIDKGTFVLCEKGQPYLFASER